ncbi:MAG: Gfo/Idh/MocA family oxidoreductase [Planctomycetota bacterium]
MTEIRVGVIGAGKHGREHARVYASMPGVRLAAVVDLDERRATKTAAEFGAVACSDFRNIPDVQAVSIAVPTIGHYPLTRHFLERGVAVLLEKPMTSTLEEAEQLAAVAGERRMLLQIGHVERFNPAVSAIESLVDAPRYIETRRVSPFSFRSTDIGVVLDLMVHDLDLVLHFSRSSVSRVEAVGVALLTSSEDMANARINFENGCVANLTVSRVARKKVREFRIFQRDRYITVDLAGGHASCISRNPGALPSGGNIAEPPAHVDPHEYFMRQFVSVEDIPMVSVEPLAAEIRSFVDCLRTGAPPVVGPEEGVAVMRVATHICRSIRASCEERGLSRLAGAPV